MPTYTFSEVKLPEKRSLKCRECGKRFTRSMTFMQTLNPFNTNAEGFPKSYPEIRAELRAEADAWQPSDLCTACTTLAASRGEGT